jgi:FAD/FMN-containing dehydrogenase
VQVGGGALWADVDRETQRFGLATPGGVVSHTGVAGLTLGGGIGWLRNAHGLSCDNLQRVEIVTAEGEAITASAARNADLFWAVRGGGGNFGVVTSFEFIVHPVGPEVAALFPVYPLQDARTVLQRWRDWAFEAPRQVSSEVVLWTAPDAEAFPPAARNRPVAIVGAVHAGAPAHGLDVIDPICKFGEPSGVIGGTLPYCGVQSAFDASFPNTGELCSYWKSLYVHQLTDAVLDVLVQAAHRRTSPATMIVVQHIGGAVHDVPADGNAFAARSAPFLINLMGTWRDPQESARHVAWVKDAWRELAALGTSSVYLNYLGEEAAEGDTLVRTAHGANYERLAKIKGKYDPDNLFRLNQNIRPARRG